MTTLDIEERFDPDIVADIRTWKPAPGEPVDLVWASPPCLEFSRESMPWTKTGETPDMEIVLGCIRVINLINPRFWIIENVRGAVPFFYPILGRHRHRYGAFFLWGFFPDMPTGGVTYRKKESYPARDRAERRAEIPETLSRKIAQAIESTEVLL